MQQKINSNNPKIDFNRSNIYNISPVVGFVTVDLYNVSFLHHNTFNFSIQSFGFNQQKVHSYLEKTKDCVQHRLHDLQLHYGKVSVNNNVLSFYLVSVEDSYTDNEILRNQWNTYYYHP